MDLDFLLFNPPKRKYTFVDFWGEAIFIPKTSKKSKEQDTLTSLLNCYQNSPMHEPQLNIDPLSDHKHPLDAQSETTAQTTHEQQHLEKHIPCLFLNSMVNSRYLLLYFHSSGQDIRLSHKLLDLLRNLYQVNVLAMQYPGYSIYGGKPNSQVIREDAAYVYNYVVGKLGFKEKDIIVVGRSIGTGVALELLQKHKPGALALISPFASIKSLAREFAGFFGQLVARQTYDNRTNIMSVSCPTFFLHGGKDETISVDNTRELAKLCYQRNQVLIVPEMTHSTFDFYSDLADPLRQFLMKSGFNFYEGHQNGPQIPDGLFKLPEKYKF